MVYYIDKKQEKTAKRRQGRKFGVCAVAVVLTAAAVFCELGVHTAAVQAVPVNVSIGSYSDFSAAEETAAVTTTKTTKKKTVSKLSAKAFDGFCAPVRKGRITSSYGYRTNPVTGVYKMHGGLDIGASSGAGIYALLDGTVQKSTKSDSYGNYVLIKHGNGYSTLYAHCSKLLVEKGQTVKAGEKIALVGATGNATGPHLHIEIRKNGQKLDPEPLLGKLYK